MSKEVDHIDYVDGYHGGHYYGVPVGSWRDLLSAVKRHEQWPLVFDLEPDSWAHCWEEDADSFYQLKAYFQGDNPRFELVNDAYGHPYGWVTDGQWLIQHSLQGRKLLEEVFGEVSLVTWAPQEPMWCSAMPGILLELGYQQAVLKDPGTAFAGYCTGFDQELIQWVGSDGRTIPAVPRYHCEGLMRAWETESRYARREFAERCRQRGIDHPVGTGLQDIGWYGRPAQPFKDLEPDADHVSYQTWQTYFQKIGRHHGPSVRLEMQDFMLAFPWGDDALDRVAQAARQSEWAYRNAMTTSVLAWLYADQSPDARALEKLLQGVLKTQHHDNWICARWREGEANFARRTERLRDGIVDEASNLVFKARRQMYERGSSGRYVHALNVLADQHSAVVSLDLPVSDPDDEICLVDEQGTALPIQSSRLRIEDKFSHSSNNHHVTVIAEMKLPSLGIVSTQASVKNDFTNSSSPLKVDQHAASVVVVGDLLGEICFDAKRGGAPLYWKRPDGALFNWNSGSGLGTVCGLVQGEWLSSHEHQAELELIERGPLRVIIEARLMLGAGLKLLLRWTMTSVSPVLDVEIIFWPTQSAVSLGSLEGEQDSRKMTQVNERESWFDEIAKLRILSGMSSEALMVEREGPFDVGEVPLYHPEKVLPNWRAIQNLTCTRWVDFRDTRAGQGVAIFTDRHTSIAHFQDEMTGLTLCWAGETFPLDQEMTRRMAFYPHSGDWQEAGIWQEARRWEAGLYRQAWVGPKMQSLNASLVSFTEPCFELVDLFIEEQALVLRLYNSAKDPRHLGLSLYGAWSKIEEIDVRGNHISMPALQGEKWASKVDLGEIQGHGFRTIRAVR